MPNIKQELGGVQAIKLSHMFNVVDMLPIQLKYNSIVEWIFLPYLKVWKECDTKILIKANEELRRSNAIKNKLITEEQYDGCVSIVKVDYSKFDYDYIFDNKYDNKLLEDILDGF